MLANEKIIYRKAYKELYKVIEILSQNEKNKIPNNIIENIKRKMDVTYEFYIDKRKTLLEQNLMPETQALIIELYQKYLSPEEEKEKWKKYNLICYEKSEQEKRRIYNPDNIFATKKENIEKEQKQLIVVEKQNFIRKIIEKFKAIFKIK